MNNIVFIKLMDQSGGAFLPSVIIRLSETSFLQVEGNWVRDPSLSGSETKLAPLQTKELSSNQVKLPHWGLGILESGILEYGILECGILEVSSY